MAQMPTSGLSWNDGATTPVAVTYSPEIVGAAKTVLVDARLGSSDFQPRVERVYLRPEGARKTYKVVDKYTYPIVRTIGGVEQVVDYNRVDVTFVRSPLSTDLEASHTHALAINGANHAEMKKNFVNKSPFWG